MRCGIPILTVVLNSSAIAIEIPHLVVSHDKYGTRDIGGRYADLGRAIGDRSERVERPEDIAGAFASREKGDRWLTMPSASADDTQLRHPRTHAGGPPSLPMARLLARPA